jgi:hypothetical protein
MKAAAVESRVNKRQKIEKILANKILFFLPQK